jgi:hypothetical protein
MSAENKNLTEDQISTPEDEAASTSPEGWYALKIAFFVNDDEELWKLPASTWLEGWELTETDSSGARIVAVFDVDHLPTAAETKQIAAQIKKAEEDILSRQAS